MSGAALKVEAGGSGTALPTPLTGDELLDKKFSPIEFAVEPFFPLAEVAEIVGAHGIYKSTLALGACLAVATGRRWGGAPTKPGAAVFITLEDSERLLANRVRAWLEGVPAGQERSDAEAKIRTNFFYLAREQAAGLALTDTDREGTFARDEVVKHLGSWLVSARLVVLETASRLHGGPELNEALAVFAQSVERIAVRSGAAVAVVRHVSKQAAREGTADSYAGRGGGAFSDAARSVLTVTAVRKTGDEDEAGAISAVRLTHSKSTWVPPAPPITWRPVSTPHGAPYLYPLSEREEATAEDRRLLAYVAACGAEGVTGKQLHGKPPEGLTRSKAKAAIDRLCRDGRLVAADEARGRTRQIATVYRLPESSDA